MNAAQFTIEQLPEFDDHALVSIIANPVSHLTAFIALHRGGLRQPAFGATRIWPYPTNRDALRDALKLSKIMTYKSALAGLHHGGAKAVIMLPQGQYNRSTLLKEYAKHVDYLGGHFITGSDVGISMDDLRLMAHHSKYMIGLTSEPVAFTMDGVFFGIQVCLKEVFGNDDLSSRTFAIQGLGKTGTGLLKHIYKTAKKIYVTDVNSAAIKATKERFPDVEVVPPKQITTLKVDIFSPCALSNVINASTVHHIRTAIVAGSANSQLESDAMGEKLYKQGILYAPDYVINAGGLIAVVDEYEHKGHSADRVNRKIKTIKKTLAAIFEKSKRTHKAPNLVADTLARNIAKKFV